MKPYEINFNEIINENDLEHGNIILLVSRPCLGKTYTCSKIIRQYSDKYKMLYFDLNGGDLLYHLKELNIDYHKEYFCSHEIIKYIEKRIDNEQYKFVFIDDWRLLDSQEDWFISMLYNLMTRYKIIFIINSNLNRKAESRKYRLPLYEDIKTIKNIGEGARKIIAIGSTTIIVYELFDKLVYYCYKTYDDIIHLKNK